MKWFSFACVVGVASTLAAQDIPGARDPDGIDRFPRSWIVEYEETAASLPYLFITAPVDKIRQDLRIEGVRVTGPAQRVTYRIPDGERLDEIAAHYRDILAAGGSGIVFSCEGPTAAAARSGRTTYSAFPFWSPRIAANNSWRGR